MNARRLWIAAVCCAALMVMPGAAQEPRTGNGRPTDMNGIAARYVKLVLALGQHDADYVDAYYGPPEWKKEAEAGKVPLDDLAGRARALQQAVAATPEPAAEMDRLRRQYLERQLSALAARVRMLKGERLSFDEESRALYDAVAPTLPEAHFQKILDQLEQKLPGAGSLLSRYEGFRRTFVIPPDKLD